MKPLLILVQPRQGPGGARVDVRLVTGGSGAAAGLGGFKWEAAVVRRPRLTIELLSPDLDGRVQVGRGDFAVNVNRIRSHDARALYWPGAPVTIYDASALDMAAAPIEFTGFIRTAPLDLDTDTMAINIEVDSSLLDKPLLSGEFGGAGGLSGDPELRGVLKPAGFGAVKNIEPVWFDTARNIGMVDGYANCLSIDSLFEGASAFGPRVADYADYATLAARIDDRTVAPGRWATCVAQGLVGLGAPPVAPITVDATFGSNTPGALMRRAIETHAGVSVGVVDTAAFSALSSAVGGLVHYWTRTQRDVQDLVEAVAASCNATPLITFQGKVSVTRAFGGAVAATINRQAPTPETRVTKWRTLEPEPPTWRMKMRAMRPGTVLTLDQVLYADDIIDRGVYNAVAVYRQGNLVWNAAGAQFLYTNATPGAGAVLPVAPATSNTSWEQTKPAPAAGDLFYSTGQSIDSLRPAQFGADVTGGNVAAGFLGSGPFATDPRNPDAVFSPRPNILPNGGFALARTRWTGTASWIWTPGTTEGAYVYCPVGGTQTIVSASFPAAPNAVYSLQAELFFGGSAGTVQVDVQWYQDAAATVPTATGHDGPGVSHSLGGWLRKRGPIVSPPGTQSGRVRVFTEGATITAPNVAAARRIKLSPEDLDVPFTDEATNGALYPDTTPIEDLQPAEGGADTTGGHTALGIVGQSDFATYTGITPALLKQNADNALSFANDVADNTKFSADEKKRYVALVEGWTTTVPAQVTALTNFGLTTEANNLNAAWNGASGLLPYLNSVAYSSVNVNTTIGTGGRTTLTGRAKTFSEALIAAANALDAAAGTRALWSGVSGTGRPTDHADVTGANQSLSIVGQSPWATNGNNPPAIGTVTGRIQRIQDDGYIEASGIFLPNVAYLSQRWPAEGGANVTEGHNSLGFAGQGPFATDQRSPQAVFGNYANLIRNGGFTLLNQAWTLGAWGVTNQGGNEGPYVVNQAAGTNICYSDLFPCYGNADYTLQGEIYVGGAYLTVMNADIEWYNGASIVGYSPRLLCTSIGWQRKLAYFQSPPSANAGRVRLFSVDQTAGQVIAARRIKLSQSLLDVPFSDEKTDGANAGQFIGRAPRAGSFLPASWSGGITSTMNAFPISDSPDFSQVTVNVASFVWTFDDGSTVTYPSASFPGLVYGTRYFLWRNDPNLDGGTSYGISTLPADALGPGKLYLGNWTTRASSGGTGVGNPSGNPDCVAAYSFVEVRDAGDRPVEVINRRQWIMAWLVRPGDEVRVLSSDGAASEWRLVESNHGAFAEGYSVTLANGYVIDVSETTPLTLRDGSTINVAQGDGATIAGDVDGQVTWMPCAVAPCGSLAVAHIRCSSGTYLAGNVAGRGVYSHNPLYKN